jgi:glycoside hydrolase-like protein
MLARRLPGLTRPWRSLAAVVTAAVLAAPVASSPATAGAAAAFQPVSYRGYSFEVPSSWLVVRLGSSETCVRFDVSVVYLGNPAADQACPSLLIGTTQALLIQPASQSSARSSVEDAVAREITVTAPGIKVTAKFDTDPGQVRQILASASLPKAVIHAPDPVAATAQTADPQDGAVATTVPPRVSNYQGLGFDTCAAPSAAYMSAWLRKSPYRAIGVYIGGSDEACAQPNLTHKWLADQAAAGWHFMPMYVGPQAEFGELGRHPGHQGHAAAEDAVAQAERLGFAAGTPIYYDMEAYPPGDTAKALRFLTAWTSWLHALGYSSGIYSSSSSAIYALAHQYRTHRYALPDVVFDALWNGRANTVDPVLAASEWADHRRVHQFAGNVAQTYGGRSINIDEDYLNVDLSGSAAVPGTAVEDARGTAGVLYRETAGTLRHLRYGPGWARVHLVP